MQTGEAYPLSGLFPEGGGDWRAVKSLVDNQGRFLKFLKRHVDSPVMAEEILQSAYMRTIEKGRGLQEGDSAVAWFFRLLRNALVDHYRRQAAEGRALERHAREFTEVSPAPEITRLPCGCLNKLLPLLKPEYAEMVRQVDLLGRNIAEVAQEMGVTPNNARVRLHRARQALKAEIERKCGPCVNQGYHDCTCGQKKREMPA